MNLLKETNSSDQILNTNLKVAEVSILFKLLHHRCYGYMD